MKKINVLMMVLVLVVIVLLSCAKEEIEPMDITIYGLNGPTSIGMIKMFEEKPSLGEGVTTTYTNVSQPDVILSKLLNEEIDIAAVPTNVASVIYNKTEGKYKVAAINTLGVLYLMTGDGVEINSLEDLKGKTINSSGLGTTPEYVLKHVLNANGIDVEKDLIIDYSLSHADLAQGLIAGNLEIALLPQPFVTMVTMKSDAKIAISMQDEWKKVENSDLAMGCIVVKTELAENKPEIINTFLAEYETSVNWVNENAVEAGELVAKFEVLPNAKMAETAIPNSNIVFLKNEESQVQMESILGILFDVNPKSIGGKMPNEDFYYKE